MKIACPTCDARYDFPVELIAAERFQARCPACGCEFRVERGGAVVFERWDGGLAAWGEAATTPVRDAAPAFLEEPTVRTPSAPLPSASGLSMPPPPFPGPEDARPRPVAGAPPPLRERPTAHAPPPLEEPPNAPPPLEDVATPAAAIFARTRPRSASEPPAEATPPPDRALPEHLEAEALTSEPTHEGYLYVRGEAVARPVRRRRVTAVRGSTSTRRPGARIMSLPATFGRARRGEPDLPSPIVLPPPEASAAIVDRPAPRRIPFAAVAAAFVVGLGGAIVFGLLSAPDRRPRPESFGAAAAPLPEPLVAVSAPPSRAPTSTLDVELQGVEKLPDKHAAVVHGQIFNGTDAVQAGVRIEATLRVDDLPKRRREVWCCEPLERDEAEAAAHDPRHTHYTRDRDPTQALRLEPGDVRSFSVVFPALDDTLLRARLGAVLKVKQAAGAAPASQAVPAPSPLPGTQGTQLGGAASSVAGLPGGASPSVAGTPGGAASSVAGR